MNDGVYLLHFEPAYVANGKMAGHYLGWAKDVDRRTADHIAGRGGSPLVNAALKAGSVVSTVAVLYGLTRKDERRLKNAHHHKRLCCICRSAKP